MYVVRDGWVNAKQINVRLLDVIWDVPIVGPLVASTLKHPKAKASSILATWKVSFFNLLQASSG